jgi:dTDP-4-dehydrorhamnose 3,5-epimerase
MEFVETKLPGAFLVRIKRIEDHRGYFGRGFCRQEFIAHGLNPDVSQLNVGFSHARGTLRGMHYQTAPHAEAKLVRCTKGRIFDVIVDLRPDSPTHRQWFGAELDADDGTMMYVPEGVAHGYLTLVDRSEIYYLASVPYASASAKGVRFDDPQFGIAWPSAPSVMSDQDKNWPAYTDASIA